MAGTETDVVETVAPDTAAPADTSRFGPPDSPQDDVRAALEQLKGDAGVSQNGVADRPIPTRPDANVAPGQAQPSQQADARPRNPDGTFATKDTAQAPAKAAAPVTPEKADAPKAPAQASTPAGPPGRFSADAKQAWSTTPPAVQAAVSRMAQEIDNAGQQWSQDRQTYRAVYEPLQEAARAVGLDPVQGLNALLTAHRALQNPETGLQYVLNYVQQAGLIPHLAQALGLDPNSVSHMPAAPQPQGFRDPHYASLANEVQSIRQQLGSFTTNRVGETIEQFASRQTHYADVESMLPREIHVVKGEHPEWSSERVLAEAYERAIWTHPEVRAKVIAEQQAMAAAEQRQVLQARSAQARNAAVSVRGGPMNGAAPPAALNGAGTGDVYDSVRAAMRQLSGGV